MDACNFEERYRTGDTPWDHGSFDVNLADTVSSFSIKPCRVLDVGCGTGSNLIWLAEQGFQVAGIDLSDRAIEQARARMTEQGIACCFQVGDFLSTEIAGAPFGVVFDRGCLHSVPEDARKHFSSRVAEVLEEGGLWLSLVGNADGPEREIGPPRMTAAELVEAVEPVFEILSLVSGVFGDQQEDPPCAWICLMRKRTSLCP
jgi:SAM-dependent methyltransferase